MARLPQGVDRRKDGMLRKRFTYNGKQISIYGHSVNELVEKEKEKLKELEYGHYTANKSITLDEYFQEWAKEHSKSVKSTSMRIYKSNYEKHIKPMLGSRKITKIEKREVKMLLDKLLEKISTSSCNDVRNLLNMLFSAAVDDDIIIKSPMKGVKGFKRTEQKAVDTIHRAMSIEEQTMFMNELKSDYYYEFIAFMLCTGMRVGEVAALSWKDIDFKNSMIYVKHTITHSEKGFIIGSAKSEKSVREIPITKSIYDILIAQREKDRVLKGNVLQFSSSMVFITPRGNFVSNYVINKSIDKTLNALSLKGVFIERFTSHAFRDTFATRFLEQGGNPKTLQEILGHSSYSMTMDIYAHVLPNTKQKEMDNLKVII